MKKDILNRFNLSIKAQIFIAVISFITGSLLYNITGNFLFSILSPIIFVAINLAVRVFLFFNRGGWRR